MVWTTLVADLETPVSAFLKIAGGKPMSFLLESVEGGAVRGRYSVIGLEPDLIWRANGTRAEINRAARSSPTHSTPCSEPPLEALRALIAESRIELPDDLPPMAAGVFGYLGYDMVRLMEELPAAQSRSDRHSRRGADPPDADRGVRRGEGHHHRRHAGAAGAGRHGERRARARAGAALGDRRCARPAARQGGGGRRCRPARRRRQNPTPRPPNTATWCCKAKEYILAGDIFQVVLSQRFEAPFTLPPFSLYRALRRVNPAPFLYFLDFGGFAIAGSSPEILVRVRGGTVTIRPIAGTRPRGATPHEDKALEEELLADPKERAEHLMLLDLGRNDVGRVAEDRHRQRHRPVLRRALQPRHAHRVQRRGQAWRTDRDALDALAAGFPAGTVSGAPKVRAMQIIDELEKEKRGLYAGCVGYFSAAGEMDSCIVLRTALIKDGTMYVQAGAGIVADSDPASEQAECVNKAKALFRAAEEARRFASAAGRGRSDAGLLPGPLRPETC